MAEIPGYNPEEAKQLREVMDALTDANALLPILHITHHGNRRATIGHVRDIASDSDVYEQNIQEPERFEDLIGWVIPFEANDHHAFAVIKASDFSTSIHFAKKEDRDWFKEIDADHWEPGKKVNLFNPTEVDHIHTDGLNMYWEDVLKRLVPTNPTHTAEIDKLLEESLRQAKERVIQSQRAQFENSENTKRSLINFLKGLQSKD
ncbi:MAG TPA: hypothetical protein VG895_01100 [Patescibacteria group bacterium]|nr:hypothetical protein [Patescibacteria group bacterium]